MSVEDRTRHDRLRTLLPRVYGTDPDQHALGVVLEVLADALREADRFTERALRDRWLRTSTAPRPPKSSESPLEPPAEPTEPGPLISLDGAPHPLELLGAALDLRRQPWEVDVETYRNRVRILAPMLTDGLATPRVMLAFALTSLHAEPCPVLERPRPDSTRGFGLPPRSLDRCPVCQGGRRPPAGAKCPMRARTLMEATVTDNPLTRAELTRSRLDPEASKAGARLQIYSDSLFADRPRIVLRVLDDAPGVVVPCIRSLTTGEELVAAVALSQGDVLTIRPASPGTGGGPRHQQVWVDPPGGVSLSARAWVVRADGEVETVDDWIMVAGGPRFGKARFSGLDDAALFDAARFDQVAFNTLVPDAETEQSRFAAAELVPQTPALRPGDNVWMVSTLSSARLDALAGDYGLSHGFIGESFDAASSPVALELSWWIRPPARFRIRIPRAPAVERALTRGSADYLRMLVDRVRPAGVHPVIDFSELFVEQLDPQDRPVAIEVRGREPLEPEVAVVDWERRAGEVLDPEDRMAFLGIFDVTRFGGSLFAERGIEPGIFDRAVFDKALLQELSVEPGKLDQTYFDHALFNEPALGRFGEGRFDTTRFA